MPHGKFHGSQKIDIFLYICCWNFTWNPTSFMGILNLFQWCDMQIIYVRNIFQMNALVDLHIGCASWNLNIQIKMCCFTETSSVMVIQSHAAWYDCNCEDLWFLYTRMACNKTLLQMQPLCLLDVVNARMILHSVFTCVLIEYYQSLYDIIYNMGACVSLPSMWCCMRSLWLWIFTDVHMMLRYNRCSCGMLSTYNIYIKCTLKLVKRTLRSCLLCSKYKLMNFA